METPKNLQGWEAFDPLAYNYAKKNGLLPKICNQMGWENIIKRKPKNYWTKERCLEMSYIYSSYSEFRIYSPAYSAASKNGWLSELKESFSLS